MYLKIFYIQLHFVTKIFLYDKVEIAQIKTHVFFVHGWFVLLVVLSISNKYVWIKFHNMILQVHETYQCFWLTYHPTPATPLPTIL